mgnify:CR=1
MLRGARNLHALSPEQIVRCRQAWELLTGNHDIQLDTTEASRNGS